MDHAKFVAFHNMTGVQNIDIKPIIVFTIIFRILSTLPGSFRDNLACELLTMTVFYSCFFFFICPFYKSFMREG